MSSAAPKILLVAPSWVGDMVMSQTLLKLLKNRYGHECQIDVLVNDWAADIVKRMPEVNAVIFNPFKHGQLRLWERIKLGFRLRKSGYDQAFVLPNSLKSALIPFFAAIPIRTGMLGEQRYGLLNDYYRLDKALLPLMIERFCALVNQGKHLSNIPYPRLAVDSEKQASLVRDLGLTREKAVVCLCPAAEFGPAKRWPAAHFAQLATQLQQQNYQVWIMGSAKDTTIAAEIVELAETRNSLHNLCGRTSLVDVVDLLACAQVVVSNDSGLMHVACAVDVPVIAIYGSSSPNFTPPLASSAQILQLSLDCSPCFQRTCQFQHYNCLQQLTPDMVLAKITALGSV